MGLFNRADVCVARLSRKAGAHWSERGASVREVRVLALVCRGADQDQDEIRSKRYQVPVWEVLLVEVVAEEESAD
jgi:hypothetical protein